MAWSLLFFPSPLPPPQFEPLGLFLDHYSCTLSGLFVLPLASTTYSLYNHHDDLLKHKSIYVTFLLKNLQWLLTTLKKKSKLRAKASEVCGTRLLPSSSLPGFPSPLHSPGSICCFNLPSSLLCKHHQKRTTRSWKRLGQGVGESIHRNMSPPWKTWFSSFGGNLFRGKSLNSNADSHHLPLGQTEKHRKQNLPRRWD